LHNGRLKTGLIAIAAATLNTQIESSPKPNNNDNTAVANQNSNPPNPNQKNLPPIVPDDPQKGQWGGSPENNGRKMTATVQELSNHRIQDHHHSKKY
jgi:hypothetical protein